MLSLCVCPKKSLSLLNCNKSSTVVCSPDSLLWIAEKEWIVTQLRYANSRNKIVTDQKKLCGKPKPKDVIFQILLNKRFLILNRRKCCVQSFYLLRVPSHINSMTFHEKWLHEKNLSQSTDCKSSSKANAQKVYLIIELKGSLCTISLHL